MVVFTQTFLTLYKKTLKWGLKSRRTSGEQTDGLPSDSQVIVVGQGSQRLVKQLLGDRLQAKRQKRNWTQEVRTHFKP